MAKRIVFGNEARENLQVGADLLAGAIRPTLGPSGRNVAVDGRRMGATLRYGPPEVIEQGQSIVRDLELPDRLRNLGVEVLKQAAKRTDDLVGDGTSTTIVLAHAMIREGMKNIVAGANAMVLKRGMEQAARVASETILGIARPLQTNEDLRSVMLSASRSEDIAEALIYAIDEVGTDGMIRVERSSDTIGVMVECEHGFQYDRGYLSPYFVTDEDEGGVDLDEPYILVTDQEIEDAADLLPLMQRLGANHALFVVAPEVKGNALGLLVTNQRNGSIRCAAARPPSYGEARQEMLQDLATFTGGVVVSGAAGHSLADVTLDDLGRAEGAYLTADDTTIYGGAGNSEGVQGRIAELKRLRLDVTDPNDADKLERRIAQLSGGIAVVQVGGATEIEMDNRLELVESALTSMRATVSEGWVPGAGLAYVRAAEALDGLQEDIGRELGSDAATGVAVVKRALEEPLRQIAANCGLNGAMILHDVRQLQRERGHGFVGIDARSGEYCDLADRGIVDPCRTVRAALANAASSAMMILTTGALVLPPSPPLSPEALYAARKHLESMDGRM